MARADFCLSRFRELSLREGETRSVVSNRRVEFSWLHHFAALPSRSAAGTVFAQTECFSGVHSETNGRLCAWLRGACSDGQPRGSARVWQCLSGNEQQSTPSSSALADSHFFTVTSAPQSLSLFFTLPVVVDSKNPSTLFRPLP